MTIVSEHRQLEKNRWDDDIGENQNDPVGINNEDFDLSQEDQN